MGGTRSLVVSDDSSTVRFAQLTVDDWLNPGDLHHRFDVHRPEVADAQRCPLERPIFHQTFQPSPELAKLTVGRDERVVNEEEVGDEAELGEGLGDRLLDTLERMKLGRIWRSSAREHSMQVPLLTGQVEHCRQRVKCKRGLVCSHLVVT
jgi:hypothetical protein